jgi:hypothetical protein
MTDTTSPRFTDWTWEKMGQNYLSREFVQRGGLYWDGLHDLAGEIADRWGHLPFEQWRDLVDLTASGTPLILTWTHLTREHVETVRATVVVDYLGTQYVRVRYCGFGHPVYLDQITSVEVPETELTFTPR